MPIPIGPVRWPENPIPNQAPTTGTPNRRGLFRRAFRGAGWLLSGPGDWLGRRAVARGGANIAALVRALRRPAVSDRRLHTADDGTFNLAATAFSHGIGLDELRARLAVRRRQTARLAWGFWSIAVLSFAAWLWVALGTEPGVLRLLSVLQFLPFVVLFALLGAREALTNFRIRELRAAGVREWLATEGRFWPG